MPTMDRMTGKWQAHEALEEASREAKVFALGSLRLAVARAKEQKLNREKLHGMQASYIAAKTRLDALEREEKKARERARDQEALL